MERKLFKSGFCIESKKKVNIEILEHIASGGKSDAYRVRYGSENKVLSWYRLNPADSYTNFIYDNFKNIAEKELPKCALMCPCDITPLTENGFGIVMDLIPEDYYELSDFLLSNVNFASFKVCVDAALNIVNAFRILHIYGYTYQDINDSCFLINAQSGDVIIPFSEYIVPAGSSVKVLCKPRFTAHEVSSGKAMPDYLSDRFSMAIILFMLMCHAHPLEGKRSLGIASPQMQAMLYGKDALFIMDPTDNSNAPDPRVHTAAIKLWSYMPYYIKDLFNSSFLRNEGMYHPARRPSEADWLKAFARFRSDIIPCRCGNEVFTQDGTNGKCEKCGADIKIPFRLHNGRYFIPAIHGTRIYTCQTTVRSPYEALDPWGMVLENPNKKGMFGIKNFSCHEWITKAASGNPVSVKHMEILPLANGTVIKCDGRDVITIIENKPTGSAQ